jgi:two-component system, NarL family, invasion response regulator UvrY
MRILIVNDHPFLLDSLAGVMRRAFPGAVVREAYVGHDAISIVREERVDVALLDIARPDHGGLALLRKITQLRPSVRCLVLTMYDEPSWVRRAMADGASGYLVKPASPVDLCDAVRAVLSGRRVVMTAAERRLHQAEHSEHCRAGIYESLSSRSRAVLSLLAKGRTVSQVAKRLGLSVKTVVVYQARLSVRLRLKTTADLVRYVASHAPTR